MGHFKAKFVILGVFCCCLLCVCVYVFFVVVVVVVALICSTCEAKQVLRSLVLKGDTL